jgi:phosphonate transport system substrate-binding protein
MVLLQKGLKLVPCESAFDPMDPEDTGYVFSYDDESTIVWVLRGKVVVGAMDNYSFLKRQKES